MQNIELEKQQRAARIPNLEAVPYVNIGQVQSLHQLGLESDEDLLTQLWDLHIKETPMQMANLEISIAKLDYEQIRFFAHSLKSKWANLGLSRLSLLAQAIELCAKDQTAQNFNELFKKLKEEYSVGCNELAKTIAAL